MVIAINKGKDQYLNVSLFSSDLMLEGVVVVPKDIENPAHVLLRKIISNKKFNNKEKLSAYQYEVYNKVQFDLNNLSQKFKDRKVFKAFDFIFEHTDSLNGKECLPFMITENVSEVYYRKSPKFRREIIKGNKISGLKNESVSQFLGDMYQNLNIYNNFVPVFGKNFISPISNSGLRHYEYFIIDSGFVDNQWCYKLNYVPTKKQELTFTGNFWVHDSTFAIKKIEGTISKNANINFIQDIWFEQKFDQVEKGVWMLIMDRLIIDVNLGEKTPGMFGKKTTLYNNFIIDKPKEEQFYSGAEAVVINDDALDKDEEFWEHSRQDSLSEQESFIYHMVDTLKEVPRFKSYIDIVTTLVTGYKDMGKIEVGPYYSLYANNIVEGHRAGFGFRTTKDFNENYQLGANIAYATLESKFKYRGFLKFFVSKNPRQIVEIKIKDDIENLGQDPETFKNSIVSSILRRRPLSHMLQVQEQKVAFEHEWIKGVSNRIEFKRRAMEPRGQVFFKGFNESGELVNYDKITATEISIGGRFAWKEKFYSQDLNRHSLGTRFPKIDYKYTLGIKGMLDGEYTFHRADLGIKQWFYTGNFGWGEYEVLGSKVWGNVPFPILLLPAANESYGSTDQAFNTMNFAEFVADETVTLKYTQHFDGYFFNKIPAIRRLKLREVVFFRGIVGRLSDGNLNNQKVDFLPNMNPLTKPFYEAGVGIENIFKIFRVDYVFRLGYLENPNISPSGLRVRINIEF